MSMHYRGTNYRGTKMVRRRIQNSLTPSRHPAACVPVMAGSHAFRLLRRLYASNFNILISTRDIPLSKDLFNIDE